MEQVPVSIYRESLYTHVEFTLNGIGVKADVFSYELLCETLRERIGLTGTKVSCGVQVCGACTVLVDGEPVSSCVYLTADVNGKFVETIESVGAVGELHPVQAQVLARNALQCGFCTPGMIMTLIALQRNEPDADISRIAEYLEGNICRCTGYAGVLKAADAAFRIMGQERDAET